jgi:hypothetical protein
MSRESSINGVHMILYVVLTRAALNLYRGDTVLIKGKKKHDTVCIAIADEDTDDTKVRNIF